jgi:alkylation response protein AidB-like acyl-CoA dehydrogenase
MNPPASGSLVDTEGRLLVGPDSSSDEVLATVRGWLAHAVPDSWRRAAAQGGPDAILGVRRRAEYEAWYPVFARSGLVAPAWPPGYGGLGLPPSVVRLVEPELSALRLGRLNPLGLNLAAPTLFAHGTEEQRLRFLPPIVRNDEVWCQLFSEPGAGSDLASLATKAERDGDVWLLTGQKIWNTWADQADWAVVMTRSDPRVPKRQGLTYFLLHMRQEGVEVRPVRHLGGRSEFTQVFLDRAVVPDSQRVGDPGDGWRVANSTLSGERQMVAGSGSGGVDRVGGSGVEPVIALAIRRGQAAEGPQGQRLAGLYAEEQIRAWTNRRVRDGLKSGRPPGPESSIGKVHQGSLNQRLQMTAVDVLGAAGQAWPSGGGQYQDGMPYEVSGMLRSRANTIEGGTTEVNKNILAERVLGLPRDPDPWKDVPWDETPHS